MPTTAEQVTNFRQAFPEFSDGVLYPNSLVLQWVTVANTIVNNTRRWGSLIELGRQLFVAHNMVLERKALDAAAAGGVPGGASGPVNSKSVDKVSVGYDTGAAAEDEAGQWNLTIYGQRYIRLARMVGIGGIQVGTGGNAVPGSWSGPWTGNFPNMNQ